MTALLDLSLLTDNVSMTTSVMPTHAMPLLSAPTLKVLLLVNAPPASLVMDSLATMLMNAPLKLTTVMPMLPARTPPVDSPANATMAGSETASPALTLMSVLPMMLATRTQHAPISMVVLSAPVTLDSLEMARIALMSTSAPPCRTTATRTPDASTPLVASPALATLDLSETARHALTSMSAQSVPTTATPMPNALTPEAPSPADAELDSTTSTTSRATVSLARTLMSASERPTTVTLMPSAPTPLADSSATADEDSLVMDSNALLMLLPRQPLLMMASQLERSRPRKPMLVFTRPIWSMFSPPWSMLSPELLTVDEER